MVATRAFPNRLNHCEAARGTLSREHLVVEHENGRLEDLGNVELRFDGAQRLEWRRADLRRAGAAKISDGNPLVRPLAVSMREGGLQLWYFGAHAQARLAAHRYNQRRVGSPAG